jgi:hypothetical protein
MPKKLREFGIRRWLVRRHRNLNVPHADALDHRPFRRVRVVAREIDDRLDAERGEISVVVVLRLRAAVVLWVDPPEVADADFREVKSRLRLG